MVHHFLDRKSKGGTMNNIIKPVVGRRIAQAN